jgi:methyl-accepting chemotaxis protein
LREGVRHQGSVLVKRAGEAMVHVVEKVGNATPLVEHVSAARDAQSADVSQFRQGIDEMGKAPSIM